MNNKIANELLKVAESLTSADEVYDEKVWKRGISDRISRIDETVGELIAVKKMVTKASKMSIDDGIGLLHKAADRIDRYFGSTENELRSIMRVNELRTDSRVWSPN